MRNTLRVRDQEVRLIGALHLPSLPGSCHPGAQPIDSTIEYALRNAESAFTNGLDAIYIQDVFDSPQGLHVEPHTIAAVAVVAHAIRHAFPTQALGICLIAHGAREPLAIAHAVGADFVRLKVYVGAMVKAPGILQGCAQEAIHYRTQIGAQDVAILADVHDRSGMPLAPLSLVEAAAQAVRHGRADGLIITGHSFDESLEMLNQVQSASLGVPLFLGGSANAKNIQQALEYADGVIVSTSLKAAADRQPGAQASDWSADKVKQFVRAARAKA